MSKFWRRKKLFFLLEIFPFQVRYVWWIGWGLSLFRAKQSSGSGILVESKSGVSGWSDPEPDFLKVRIEMGSKNWNHQTSVQYLFWLKVFIIKYCVFRSKAPLWICLSFTHSLTVSITGLRFFIYNLYIIFLYRIDYRFLAHLLQLQFLH